MKALRLAKMKVGAPAVVMLATIVNVAAAGNPAYTQEFAGAQTPPVDLSWALKGGATHAAQSTRIYIARKAATSIHSLDRLHGAQANLASLAVADVPVDPCACLRVEAFAFAATHHASSSFQHSAP